MNTIRVSATKARNNFFQLLDKVAAGASVVVEKDSKEVAEIVSRKRNVNNKGLMKALRKAAKGFVYSEKNNPLRRPGATSFLGRWGRE